MNLIDKLRHMWREDYIVVEIRSECYNQTELKQHSSYVKDSLQKKFPDLDLISFKRSNEIEMHRHLFLAVYGIKSPGHIIKFTPTVNLLSLKDECMRLEIQDDKRVSDIDIYVRAKNEFNGYKKISRKT